MKIPRNVLVHNCTWPLFGSLAVCRSCHNVTNYVKRLEGSGTDNIKAVERANFTCFELPYLNICNFNGLRAQAPIPGATMTANRTGQAWRTMSFQNNHSLIIAFGFLKAANSYNENVTAWENTTITGTECGLYLCANMYELMVENGTLIERIFGILD
jgi:hypothetical protein